MQEENMTADPHEDEGSIKGSCAKCGRETVNRYPYYCGDYVNPDDAQSGNEWLDCSRYAHVTRRTLFVCTRCILGKGRTAILVFTGVALAGLGMVCVTEALMGRRPMLQVTGWFCGGLVLAAFMLFLGLWWHRLVKKDKKVSWGFPIEIAQKANPGKYCFDPGLYKLMLRAESKKKRDDVSAKQDGSDH